jgi:hypothetical protein
VDHDLVYYSHLEPVVLIEISVMDVGGGATPEDDRVAFLKGIASCIAGVQDLRECHQENRSEQ